MSYERSSEQVERKALIMAPNGVEFSACQVSAIGVRGTVPAVQALSATQVSPARPLPDVSSVKRNLFGSPQSGDIQKMLTAENKRVLKRWRKRYSFDPTCDSAKKTDNENEKNLPNCISTTNVPCAVTTPRDITAAENTPPSTTPTPSNGHSTANGRPAANRGALLKAPTKTGSVARHLPYTPQPLITDHYTKRKSIPSRAATVATENQVDADVDANKTAPAATATACATAAAKSTSTKL